MEINLLDRYPKSQRPVEERGTAVTEDHRKIAREFGFQYFDADRLYGYGGYRYHPRFWQETVRRFKEHYKLRGNSRLLDVGCAKGFMLRDFKELMPTVEIAGIDISDYALENADEKVKPFLRKGNAKKLPFDDRSFDLVISINTIHNLALPECRESLREIERVSRGNSFIVVDAWRNDEEKTRFMKWNLTALTAMHVDDWKKLFNEAGYTGDYYWFFA